ncbi:DUF1656 domain-containing protein [Bradyrhizobium niftali]|uniref:DUF1656 domain-containing protein n=1 Tax=Bradyrhizobium niftali TaxID=2560055 RepID=UPI003850A6F5
MRFAEIDLLGVYVAPISVLMVVAWIATLGLSRVAARFGLLRHVWHPALFVFDLYIILLSSLVFLVAR